MNDWRKTGIFGGVAAVLVVLCFATMPRAREAASFNAQGTEFYPGFKDPLKVAALEVIQPDDLSGGFKPFRVQVVDGQWSIPSHSNYPADGKDRLAKTAASVIDLKKERLASNNPKDYAEFGVNDPSAASEEGKKGRGNRVKLFDQAGAILADYIFGKETKEGPDYRYVRVPDQKETWAVKVKPDISVKFEDWVETDLLKFGSASARRIVIDKYTFDVTQQQIKDKAVYTAARDDSAAPWKVAEMKDTEEVNTETLTTLTSTLTGLKLTGVRPKPEYVAKAQDLSNLGKMPQNVLMAVARALGGKGFYIFADKDRYGMISSEGEMQVSCDDGVVYTLRFGDVLVGSGDEISAGLPDEKDPKDEKPDPKKDEKKDEKKGGVENRYLMVSARFDESLIAPAPPEPKAYVADPAKKPEEQKADEEKAKKDKEDWETKKKDVEKKKTDGKKRAEELTKRFAPWYYVISGDAFKKLRVERSALVKAKEVPKDEKKPEDKKPEPPKEEKKPEPPKEEKKPEAPKDDKKPDEKKPEPPKDEKKPEEKK